jgi:hypothetical protein
VQSADVGSTITCAVTATIGSASTTATSSATYIPAYETEATSLFAAMSVQPSEARKTAINNLIVALKSADVWSSLDILYVMAAHDSQAGLLNWKNPSSFTLTGQSGAPTFTTDRGYNGGGTSAFSTGYIPSTNGANLVQDSASHWCWSLTDTQFNITDLGRVGGNGDSLTIRTSTNVMGGRCSDNDSSSNRANSGGVGFFGVSRVSSSTKRFWKNGSQVGIDVSTASTARSTVASWVCGANSGTYSSRQQAAAAWGDSLSGKESAFYSALLAYMQAVGAA